MNNADVHILILAGGKGTRSANPLLPKILQVLDDGVTLLDLHLANLNQGGFRDITFLLGHGSKLVIDDLERAGSQYPQLRLNWLIDPAPLGTREAVTNAVEYLGRDKRFGVILGDTAIVANIGGLAKQWIKGAKEAAFVAHPNHHPTDSDRVSFDETRTAVDFIPKGSSPADTSCRALPITGLIFFEGRSVSTKIGSHGDLVKQLVASCLERDEIHVIVTSQYFRDSGTPERLESLVKDFRGGIMQRRGSSSRPGIFLDRDGTLIPDAGTGRKSLAEGDIEQSVATAIAEVNKLGIPIFLVTNQPGLAKGQIQVEDVDRVHEQINRRLAQGGAYLDDIAYCPHHPEVGYPGEVIALKRNCLCRKPEVGMVSELAEKHFLALSESVMIGDSDADLLMAQNAGMHFIAASVSALSTEEALKNAIRKILA